MSKIVHIEKNVDGFFLCERTTGDKIETSLQYKQDNPQK